MKSGLVIILFIVNSVSAQTDTIEYKTYYDDGSVHQKYQITLPDSARNGYYKSYIYTGLLIVYGRFSNNKRIGIWNFYTGRHLYEKYDFDKNTELFFDSTYEENKGWPHFPGGSMEFNLYIVERCNYDLSKTKIQQNAGKSSYLLLDINDNGTLSNVRVAPYMNSVGGTDLENAIIKIINESPKWIQSKNEFAKDRPTSYAVPVKF